MKRFNGLSAAGIAMAIASLASSPALATEGYFSHGYGAVNKSMAGAGVALSMDAMSQAINPASLTGVDSQFTADLSIFSPRREYNATNTPLVVANPSGESDRNYFFIPSLAGSYAIDDVSAFGWAIYANGGMNTTYPGDGPVGLGGPFGFGKTGVDLGQGFLQLTYARELSTGVSVGISPILAAQRFKAFGLQCFGGFCAGPNASSDNTKLTNNGYDWSYGYGGKIGVQAQLAAGLSFGASYQSRMYMTEFDEYAGLFAEQGDFDIPATLQAGISWDSGSGVMVAFDYKRIFYGDIDSIANPLHAGTLTGASNLLGADDGSGFGWETINAYKLGVQFEASPTVKVRLGVGLNDNPIPNSEVTFNILAPGVQEQHYTAGLTWQVDPNNAVNFGAMYSPSNSITGQDPFGAHDITIEMYQWEATVGWTWTF